MKKIIIAALFLTMVATLCACGSSSSSQSNGNNQAPAQAKLEYYEENEILPTPIGVTSLVFSASNTSTSNGAVRLIEYKYEAKEDVNAELDKYLNVLEEQGFVIDKNADPIAAMKDDVLIASISIEGNLVIVSINPQAIASDTDNLSFVEVNFGDTIELDFATLTIGEIGTGKISVGGGGVTYSQSASSEGNDLYWLPITVKNLNGEEFKITGSHEACKMIFDDKYTYNGNMRNIEGGNARAIGPLESRTIFLYAEVPNELLDSYQTVKIQFGFDKDFAEDGMWKELGEYEYLYQLSASK